MRKATKPKPLGTHRYDNANLDALTGIFLPPIVSIESESDSGHVFTHYDSDVFSWSIYGMYVIGKSIALSEMPHFSPSES